MEGAASALEDGESRIPEPLEMWERASGEDRVEPALRFEVAGDPFLVTIEPRVPGRRYLASGGPYGAGYDAATPPSAGEAKALMLSVAAILEDGADG